MSVCLDSFAVLAWLQDEPGAEQVAGHLKRAAEEEDFACYISVINLGEVFYRLLRVRGAELADRFWQGTYGGILPLSPIEVTRKRVREAATLKGLYPIAFADAFASQLAMELGVPLVTGDPEIRILARHEPLAVEWLPGPRR